MASTATAAASPSADSAEPPPKRHRHSRSDPGKPDTDAPSASASVGAAAIRPRALRAHGAASPPAVGCHDSPLDTLSAVAASVPAVVPAGATVASHSYQLQCAPTADSLRCAELVLQLRAALRRDSRNDELQSARYLTGGAEQYRVRKLVGTGVSELRTAFTALWPRVAAAAIAAAGLPPLPLVDAKLLIAQPGWGEQDVHWDSTLGANGVHKYSIILYCTAANSTALPLFTNAQSLSTPYLRRQQRLKLLPLLHRRNYASVPVQAGSILVMRQSVPHYGVAAPNSRERVVLFDMASPSPDWRQDEKQHTAACYEREARGIRG